MQLEQLILGIPVLLLAISIHEFSHGYAAHQLGDPTPASQGRLTLNPLAHLDPLGAVMLLVFRFGWAKPVLVNPLYFRDRQKGMVLVALAGPLANLLLAWVFYLCLAFVLPLMPVLGGHAAVQLLCLTGVQLNLGLAAFNLLPIPPLDGSKILGGLLPSRYAFHYQKFAQYGPLVLILLLMTGTAQVFLRPIYSALLLVITVFG